MSNIKQMNFDDDSDSDPDHNEYYAGGEKRWVVCALACWDGRVLISTSPLRPAPAAKSSVAPPMRCVVSLGGWAITPVMHADPWPVPVLQNKDRVGSLFDRAKAAGAEQGTTEDLEGNKGTFSGTGRTLAGGVNQVGSIAPHAMRHAARQHAPARP